VQRDLWNIFEGDTARLRVDRGDSECNMYGDLE
jgi:hypothetical protein